MNLKLSENKNEDKYILIDSRMRDFEKEKLQELGYRLIEIKKNNKMYPEISSHVDIHATKINNTVIIEKDTYEYVVNKIGNENIAKLNNKIICGDLSPTSTYPSDVMYNVCCIGKNVVHNFKYTDNKVMNVIKDKGLEMINIKQGYSKCSIAVIDDSFVILSDKTIAKRLNEFGIETLVVDVEDNIKLLGEDGKYSKMSGFIGGVISRIGDYIFVSGDLKFIKDGKKIRENIIKRNLKIIDFKEKELIDYGSILDIN